ncbi:MAG: quinone-dependent dihydroorotate dehydrogenase [Alphaproteobacteria bacterium]|nr:quinone-dependent dihydroorotate dehydrogenase [Alphaproteobacteria bacterium]
MLHLYKYAKPLIFKVDPESAHQITLRALKTGILRPCSGFSSDTLKQSLWGLEFKNPVGLSAGFDKNAEVIAPILKLGFGSTEIGTVTPLPQNGNPKPRIFRDPERGAVINRLGFPNCGAVLFKKHLEDYRKTHDRSLGVVGVNIGMNKEQTDPAADYCFLIKELSEYADYLTVNISSPNTPGLRDLQEKGPLTDLLGKLTQTREELEGRKPPILVKLAPDLTEKQQEDIAETLLSCKIDGIILSNTTLDRPDYLPPDFSDQKGGLSGLPVKDKSTALIRNFYKLTKGKLPIIGVGGISTAEDAYEKIKSGASLVQLYTGMIYEGPLIAQNINKGLVDLLERDGHNSISDAIACGHFSA